MKVSYNWLKEFVDIPVGARELGCDLTMVGLNVESATAAGNDWILDVEVTTNRPDCLSHYGVAREVAFVSCGLHNRYARIPSSSSEFVEGRICR